MAKQEPTKKSPAKKVPANKGGARPQGSVRTGQVSSSTSWAIMLLAAIAVVLSAFLVAKHFGGGLPGCGPKSGCESLEATPWGKVPGIGWPVAFLGLSYFIALLAGWAVAGRQVPPLARGVMWAGAGASLLFVAAMIAYRKFCPYCAGAHAANLLTVFLLERDLRRTTKPGGPGAAGLSGPQVQRILGVAAGAFLVATVALAVANSRYEAGRLASAEADRRASTDRILAQTPSTPAGDTSGNTSGNTSGTTPGAADGSTSGSSAGAVKDGTAGSGVTPTPGSPAGSTTPATTPNAGKGGFTGRYLLGPEASPIRIVMLTDYQCIDCQRVEGELEEILASRRDVSLSVKYFPMCMEASPGVPCNKYAQTNMHPNACWAARAAEAAGILYGNDGFWKMHRWLFAHKGGFTDAEIKAAEAQMGFDVAAFTTTMMGPETLRRVQADCDEGFALGLYFTPMVFVNGVEFKGWQVPGALKRTIEEVAAKNPPALTSAADRPALASQKDVDDWMAQPVRTLPPDTRAWSMGAKSAAAAPAGSKFVDVVVWGDYQEPYTNSMDIAIRAYAKSHPGVRYTFRHFPIDPPNNPALPAQVRKEAIHPLAGKAAKAAEAAGTLGGADAYWKMHAWLMENRQAFSDETLRAAAGKMGLDPARLFAEMQAPATMAAIVEDARGGQQVGLNGVPMCFVNGRWIQRTLRDTDNIVLRVIDAAGRP